MFSLSHTVTHTVCVCSRLMHEHTHTLSLSLSCFLSRTHVHTHRHVCSSPLTPLTHRSVTAINFIQRDTPKETDNQYTHTRAILSHTHTLSFPLCHTRTHTDLLPCPTPDGETHLKRLKVNTMPVWVNVMFLFGLMIFFRTLGYYALVKRANKLVIENTFLRVYICIYKHVSVCVCVRVCVCERESVYMYWHILGYFALVERAIKPLTFVYLHMYIYIQIYIWVRVCVCACVCVFACVCVHILAHPW